MKNIILIKRYAHIWLGGVLALMQLSSCSDILDKEPILETSATELFSSSKKISEYLEGVYQRLGSTLPSYFSTTDMRGDEFDDILQNGNLSAYDMNLSVDGTSGQWNGLYRAIGEANDFLNHLESARDVVGDAYEQYRSEALFVRALSYYYLTVLYARTYHLQPDALAVPLRLGTPETSQDDLAPSTIEAVHQQILADVSDAHIAALPTGKNSISGVTHATQAAAHVLRQRIYLERWEWQKAIDEGEAIQGYALGGLTDVFVPPYYTEESILSFPYGANNPNSLAASFYLANSTALEDTYSGIFALPLYAQEGDVRFSQLTYKPNTHRTITKYRDVSSGSDWIPVFRYSEVLLNLAEAYDQLGQEDKAKTLLLQVRRRAISAEDDQLDESSLSGRYLREAIYLERRIEFVGEGIRSIDIHRRGETFWKRKGGNEIIVGPADSGYIFPIPLSETSQNKLIKSDH